MIRMLLITRCHPDPVYEEDCNKLTEDTKNEGNGFCISQFSNRKGSQLYKDVIKCSQTLTKLVKKKCIGTRTSEEGSLSYCKQKVENGQYITCCVKEYKCEFSWKTIRYKFPQIAVNFKTDPDQFLKEKTAMENYKTCHKIEGLNAEKCYNDCEAMRDSNFASKCNYRGGLFKCCIRRDKANCHECRFCCTLPICTWTSNKELIHATEDVLNELDKEETKEKSFYREEKYELTTFVKSKTAYTISSLNAMDIFYKSTDERCLKPDLSQPVEKWGHYVPEEFVRAQSQNDLSTSKTVEYDNHFFNFEDPDVFRAFTNSSYKKMWRQVYGFDYMSMMPYNGFSENMECAKKCMKAEKKSKFARQCKKKGGFFKCCVFSLDLEIFERTHNLLKDRNLTSSDDKITKYCERRGTTNHCFICFVSYMCSKKDAYAQVNSTYKSEEPNSVGGITIQESCPRSNGPCQKKFSYENIGEDIKRFGLRFTFCSKLDFCKILPNRYSPADFFLAHDWESFCSVKEAIETKVLDIPEAEKKECLKRKSNVRICPKKELEKLNDMRLRTMNKELRAYAKKLKRKKKKKRKKSKRKRKKSKNLRKYRN